jgi:hypothetical protein
VGNLVYRSMCDIILETQSGALDVDTVGRVGSRNSVPLTSK